jgi:membrane fusion protein
MRGVGWQPTVVAGQDRSPADEPLFRPEVIAERQTQWLGTVLIAPRFSHSLFTAFAALTAAAILGLLIFASYTRKERINGWLVPQQGLVRVFAPQAGVVTQLYVREGAEVRKDTPLLAVSTDLRSEALGATQEEIARLLVARRASLTTDRDLQQRMFTRQTQELSSRLAALRSEQQHLAQEFDLQKKRLALAEDFAAKQRYLRERGLVIERTLQEAEQDRLDHALSVRAIERNRLATEREILTLEGQLRDLPLKSQSQLAVIDREIAGLEQELAETEARRQIVIHAPEDGMVTAIQAEPGSRADATVPVLSIVPAGSKLQAHLFSPSRAIGFVRPSQHVLLRYQAFPYQKFGHHEGVVASVSRSAISPGELPQQLSALAGQTGTSGTSEPVYRITVDLASQTVAAYGEPVRLQPGMQLEAHVLIESRRLIEWVLAPLFTISGSWTG